MARVNVKKGNIVSIVERFLLGIEVLCDRVAGVAAYLVLPLVAVVVFEVVARYAFHSPTIWAFEMSRFIGGSLFVLGMAWGLTVKAHIRVDIFYQRWSPRQQAFLDAVLTLFLVLPVLIFSIEQMITWTWQSWAIHEVSSDTAWRVPIYPFKTVMPVAMLLLLAAVVPMLVRDVRTVVRK